MNQPIEIYMNLKEDNLLKLKAKLRLLNVIIRDVVNTINKIEGGKNAKEFKA